ncbi:MAG: hypothetical protein RLZZ584_456 [Pseudomonadota bacterium]
MQLRWTHHPLTLLVALAAGGLLGRAIGPGGALTDLLDQVFSRLMQMAAMPIVMVSVVFGVRSALALPQRGRRLTLVVAGGLASVWLCGVCGALIGGGGGAIGQAELVQIGALVERTGGSSELDVLALRPERAASAPTGAPVRRADNVFAPLARGDLAVALGCALAFGLAVAALGRHAGQALTVQLEAVYRALERLIGITLHLMPLLAFSVALHVAAGLDAATLALLGRVLRPLALAALPVAALALALVCWGSRSGLLQVLDALKSSLMIALVAPSPVTVVPVAIDALSRQVGLARGITEVLVPAGSLLLRAGSALHAALVAVLVARLYGLAPDALDLLWIGTLAAAAALCVPAVDDTFGALGTSALALLWLQLPGEAMLPVLLLVDRVCVGPRQVLTVLCVCAVCAVAARGLAVDRPRAVPGAGKTSLMKITLGRSGVLLMLSCIIAACVLCVLAGIGVGMSMETPR